MSLKIMNLEINMLKWYKQFGSGALNGKMLDIVSLKISYGSDFSYLLFLYSAVDYYPAGPYSNP